MAQNYRNPLHRQCGDIDLYIGPKNYEKANKLLRTESTGEHEENHKHTCIHWHGVDIENHRVLSRLSSPSSDKSFQQEIARWHGTTACRNLEIEGYQVTLPPLSFDVAYVLTHSALHFLNEGIGLRQVCDWANILHTQKTISILKKLLIYCKMGIKQSSQNIRGCCRKLSGTSHGRFAYPLYSKRYRNR